MSLPCGAASADLGELAAVGGAFLWRELPLIALFQSSSIDDAVAALVELVVAGAVELWRVPPVVVGVGGGGVDVVELVAGATFGSGANGCGFWPPEAPPPAAVDCTGWPEMRRTTDFSTAFAAAISRKVLLACGCCFGGFAGVAGATFSVAAGFLCCRLLRNGDSAFAFGGAGAGLLGRVEFSL